MSLVRCTAKVTLSLRVDERIAGEIALQSVRVGHAPGTVALFSDNRAAESALIDYAKRSVTGNAFSGTFYIPENLQGVNASITDQRDKSAANAPAAPPASTSGLRPKVGKSPTGSIPERTIRPTSTSNGTITT